MIPSSAACSYGGSSWLMELSYLNGAMPPVPVFDTNADGVVNASDTPVGGRKSQTIASAPAIQLGLGNKQNPMEAKFLNESSGTVTEVTENRDPTASRRTAWGQIE
jgi:type IV pilus assembly protein PilY1